MCYMERASTTASPRTAPPGQVGVRELRQNLSVYLERVVLGESLEVTDRGRVVAMLVPLRLGATLVDRLIASGRATPATRRLEDVPRLRGRVPRDLGARAQRALQGHREDTV
jgi:prevent-host-death family protein